MAINNGYAILRVEIDWNHNGQFDHTLVDVIDDIVPGTFQCRRGRDFASSTFGRSVTGFANFRLRNIDQKYNGINSSSPLFGKIGTGLACRFTYELPNMSPVTLWYGYIDKFGDELSGLSNDEISITCYGLIGLLDKNNRINIGLTEEITTEAALTAVLDQTGLRYKAISGNRTLYNYLVSDQRPLEAIRDIEEAEQGFFLETRDGYLSMQSNTRREFGSGVVPQVTLGGRLASDTTVPFARIRNLTDFKEKYNAVQININSAVPNDNESVVWENENVILVEANSRLELTFGLTDELITEGAIGIHLWIDPQTDSQPGQDYTPVPGITVSGVADGNRYTLVLTNTTNNDLYFEHNPETGIPAMRLRAITLVEGKPSPITNRLSPQGGDGELLYRVPQTIIRDSSTAVEYNGVFLDRHENPPGRILVDWDARYSPMTPVLVDLSSRVRTIRDNVQGDIWVENITYAIQAGGRLLVEYRGTVADITQRSYFPFGLSVTGQTTTSVSLSWNEATTNGSTLVGYNLQYRIAKGIWRRFATTGTGTTATITGLDSNTNYEFRIASLSNRGRSDWSRIVTAKTNAISGAPAKVTGLTITLIGSSTATASWTAVTGALSYEVEYRGRFNTALRMVRVGSGTTYELTGLSSNDTYTVRVRAFNAAGAGEFSDAETFTTLASTVPDAPRNLSTVTKTGSSITIEWDYPLDDGGSPVIRWNVEYTSDTIAGWREVGNFLTRRAIVENLDGNTEYRFRVRGENRVGLGDYSDEYTESTTGAVPGDMAAPRLVENTLDSDSAQILFAPPTINPAGINRYGIRFRHSTTETVYQNYPHDGIGTTAFLTGLTSATDYYVSVRAGNALGFGNYSPELMFTTAAATGVPNRPNVPIFVSSTADMITFRWSAPTSPTTITAYQYRYRVRGGDWTVVNHDNLVDLSDTIENLRANQLYEIQVNATNSNGTSFWSPGLIAQTGVAVAPDAPTNLVASNAMANSVDITWDAGAEDGGSSITRWGIEYRTQTDSNWQLFNYTELATATTITGLAPSTFFQIRVRAFNIVGPSNYSNTATISTLAGGGPDAPVLSSSGRERTTLSIQWTEPNDNGSPILDYDIEFRTSAVILSRTTSFQDIPAGQWFSFHHDSTTRTATLTGLPPGTNYDIRVRAQNAVNIGPWSNVLNTSTLAPAIAIQPRFPKAIGTVNSLESFSSLKNRQIIWWPPRHDDTAVSYYALVTPSNHDTRQIRIANRNTFTAYDVTLRPASTTYDRLTAITQTSRNDAGAPHVIHISEGARQTPGTIASRPSRPVLLHTTAGSNNTFNAQIRWTGNGYDFGGDAGNNLIRYDVQYWHINDDETDATTTIIAHNSLSTIATITGLARGETIFPQVRVVYTDARGIDILGEWSEAIQITVPDATEPGQVSGLELVSRTDTTATIRWTAPPDGGSPITDYDVSYIARFGGGHISHDHTGTANETTITGLRPGEHYRVRVLAENDIGQGLWSDDFAFSTLTVAPTGAPGQVATPTLVSVTAHTITFNWAMPTAGASAITGYNIRYRVGGSGSFIPVAFAGTGTQSTIAGLDPGQTYEIEVQAQNSQGQGNWSVPPLSATTSANAPGRITDFRLVNRGETFLNLIWGEPDDGGSEILRYEIRYRLGRFGSYTTVTTTQHTYGITGLILDSEYQIDIRAVNSVDNGPRTELILRTEGDVGKPGAPTNLQEVGQTTSSLMVSWDEPTDTGNSAITRYVIAYVGADGTSNQITHTAVNDRLATIPNLQRNERYLVSVAASNAQGLGPYSSQVTMVTAASEAEHTPARPTGLSVVTARTNSIDWIWSLPGGGAGVTYDFDWREGTSGSFTTVTGLTSATYTLSMLDDGTLYSARVRARNAQGPGPYSQIATGNTLTIIEVPDTMVAPTVDQVTETSVRVNWVAPGSVVPITHFDIQIEDASGTTTSTENISVSARSQTITGLTQNARYRVRIRATNAGGDGEWSPWTAFTTVAAPGVPDAPSTLRFDQRTQSVIALGWTAPNMNRGTFRRYEVQRKLTSEGASAWGNTQTPTSTGYTYTGLTAGTSYDFRVRAVNSVGPGDWSSTLTTTTLDPAPVPEAPSQPTTTNVGRLGYRLNWVAPTSQQPITGYIIQHGIFRGSLTTTTVGNVLRYDFTGLQPGTIYTARVAAISSEGTGAYSPFVNVTTATTSIPSVVRNLASSQITQTSFRVSWQAELDDGGARFLRHEIDLKLRSQDDSAYQRWSNTARRLTHTDITGRTAGTEYTVRVRSVNTIGGGPYATLDVTTAAIPRPTKVTGLSSANVGTTAFTLSWTAIAGATYQIEYRIGAGAFGNRRNSLTNQSNYINLRSGTTYVFRVRAVNRGGEGDWSDNFSVTTMAVPMPPPKVFGLSSSNVLQDRVTISWGQVVGATHYRVQRRTGTSGDFGNEELAFNSFITVTGLTHSTMYQFRVLGINNVGDGEWSDNFSVTTAAPLAKVAITSSSKTETTATLNWSSVPTATSYQVERKLTSASGWGNQVTRTSTSITITGLTSSTSYDFRVRATNASGEGEWSDTRTITTDAPTTVPGNVSNLQSRVTRMTVALTWTAAAGATSYHVERKLSSGSTWGSRQTVSVTNHTYTGLTTGTSYDFRVRGVNVNGNSPSWTTISNVVPAIGSIAMFPTRELDMRAPILLPNGNILYFGEDTRSLYIFNPINNTFGAGRRFTSTEVRGAILLNNQKIIYTSSERVGRSAIYSLSDDTSTILSTPFGGVSNGVLLSNGHVQYVSNRQDRLYTFNPTNNVFSLVNVSFPDDVTSLIQPVLLPNGNILYTSESNPRGIHVFSGTAFNSGTDFPMGEFTLRDPILLSNGNVIYTGFTTDKLYTFNTTNNTFDSGTDFPTGEFGLAYPIQLSNGNILYFASRTAKVYNYNPSNNTFDSGVSVSSVRENDLRYPIRLSTGEVIYVGERTADLYVY